MLEEPFDKIKDNYRHHTSMIQETLNGMRLEISQYRSQKVLSSKSSTPLTRKISRSDLYQLEALIQVISHPFILNLIPQEKSAIQDAHLEALLAELKDDTKTFREAYKKISHILETYTRAQATLAQSLSQGVHDNIRELETTD
jgi:hypothetical protein